MTIELLVLMSLLKWVLNKLTLLKEMQNKGEE